MDSKQAQKYKDSLTIFWGDPNTNKARIKCLSVVHSHFNSQPKNARIDNIT